MSSSLAFKVTFMDDEDTLHAFLNDKSVEYFQEYWENPAYACPSDAPFLQLRPKDYLNEERSRMGSDHNYACVSYGCLGGPLQRKTVKFLRRVREEYGMSEGGNGVIDACFILLDKMLHADIDDEELFDRLHCMFVNDGSLVQGLFWLSMSNMIWTRHELVERIWGFENYTRECIKDGVREEFDKCLMLSNAKPKKKSRKKLEFGSLFLT